MEMASATATTLQPRSGNSTDSDENGMADASATAHCLWCGRPFSSRKTGGSVQKFCSTGHRQAFWIAARRWTLLAIDAGLLSVECLKAAQASVHAATAVP
jgi:hypothetical protein